MVASLNKGQGHTLRCDASCTWTGVVNIPRSMIDAMIDAHPNNMT